MQKNKLPVLETIYKSIAYPWYFRKRLALALLPMFVALVFLEIVSIYIPGESDAKTFVFSLIATPLTILYTITIHRIMILGFDSTPRLGMFEWRGREWNFLLYSLGLGILFVALAALPLTALSNTSDTSDKDVLRYVAMFIVCLPAALVFARLSLVFPATAIDSNFSLLKTWKVGQGNSIRLAIIVYWVHVAGIAFFHLLPDLAYQHFNMFLTVAGVLLGYILWAVQIACLSFAYKYLVVRPEES